MKSYAFFQLPVPKPLPFFRSSSSVRIQPFRKAILKELGIEGDYEGIGNCVIGYAKEPAKEAAPRKADYVHYIK